MTFQDARGEEPGGPDVAGVVVSNGDAGLITFRISIPTHPVVTDDMRLRVWVDSDSNAETGLASGIASTKGWDYFLLWDRQTGREDPSLFRCTASTCTGGGADPPQRTLRFSYANGPTLTILDAELGNTRRFRFFVEAADGIVVDPATGNLDPTNAHWDYAPGLGRFWSYDVRRGLQRLLVKSFSTAPAVPRAGSAFTVSLAATRSDTRALLTSGRVACAARIGGKPLRPRSQRFVGTRATCVFAIPPGAEGTIRGSISVLFRGKTVTRSFARRIGP